MGNLLTRKNSSTSMNHPMVPFPIEKLPRELVWKIIEYAPNVVFHLRLTSLTLKSIVDEFAMQRSTILLAHDMLVIGRDFENTSIKYVDAFWMSINIMIKRSKSNLFELRLRLRDPNQSQMKRIGRDGNSCYSSGDCYNYSVKFNSSAEFEGIIDLLRESMGAHIQEVRVFDCIGNPKLECIYELVKEKKLDKLHFDRHILTEVIVKYILKIINGSRSVRRFSLSVSRFESSVDPVQFLLQLSSLVRVLSIGHCDFYDKSIRRGARYFFGVHDLDWSPVILEMLSRKVDKLIFDSDRYENYLSQSEVNVLMKKIPEIKKKVYFQTWCDQSFEETDYVYNDNIVRLKKETYDGDRQFDMTLVIKHKSRRCEGRNHEESLGV